MQGLDGRFRVEVRERRERPRASSRLSMNPKQQVLQPAESFTIRKALPRKDYAL
jgi:hypothetical protein